jgi:amidophosphoribosyltransferase
MGTNTQPFIVETIHGPVALAHNGQLTQGRQMRQKLMEKGVGMFTSSDSECIIQSIASRPDPIEEHDHPNWEARIAAFMVAAEGAYSCVLMTRQGLFAFRDPHGLRPLCLGTVHYHVPSVGSTASLSSSAHKTTPDTAGFVVASESCALSTIGAELLRDIRPGELVRIDEKGISTVSVFSQPAPQTDRLSQSSSSAPSSPTKATPTSSADSEIVVAPKAVTAVSKAVENVISTSRTGSPFPRPNRLPNQPAFCVFEYVYFARPDSVIEGRLVHAVRQNLGRNLAKESPVAHADVVVGVPDSSTPIAIGYAQECGKPFTEGLTKNRYIARTFIQPDQSLRVASVELKYNTLGVNLKDKVVVLVDDSIVRGTTSAQLVALLKRGGAKEVHLRIGSPPVRHPCFMGIDMRTGNELIAATSPLDEIAKQLGADSLAYISHDGMMDAVREANSSAAQDAEAVNGFCSACFSGEYPLPVDSW